MELFSSERINALLSDTSEILKRIDLGFRYDPLPSTFSECLLFYTMTVTSSEFRKAVKRPLNGT